jgi:hypothetical protein
VYSCAHDLCPQARNTHENNSSITYTLICEYDNSKESSEAKGTGCGKDLQVQGNWHTYKHSVMHTCKHAYMRVHIKKFEADFADKMKLSANFASPYHESSTKPFSPNVQDSTKTSASGGARMHTHVRVSSTHKHTHHSNTHKHTHLIQIDKQIYKFSYML